ncbi:MAG TPA: hypothetical protein VNQ90_13535 [Chthoniobacteraceae bacterium]|nr:hypothetical protein [Chthoniobacteraceae bacterium]
MKRLLPVLLAFVPLASVTAADYTRSLSNTRTWDSAADPWVSSDPEAPLFPSSPDDRVLDITGDASYGLILGGARELLYLGKTSKGTIRLYNTAGANESLTVGEMKVFEGQWTPWSQLDEEGKGSLTVSVGNLWLGSSNPPEDTKPTGRISFGSTGSNPDFRKVDFQVKGVTRLEGYNPAVTLDNLLNSTDTSVDLGHVVFALDVTPGGTPGLGAGAIADVLKVKSLRTVAGTEGRGDIRGSGGGTLTITGDAGDPFQPEGPNLFSNSIINQIKIKKTGTNLQIFDRASGNTYTGGTEISNGTLAIRNTSGSGLGRGAVEVSGSGTLAGNGWLVLNAGNAVTVKTGGRIAPGEDNRLLALDEYESAAFQTLTLNGSNQTTEAPLMLAMENGSSFTFRLDATGASDRVSFLNYRTGGLTLGSEGIAINIDGALAPGATYTLFSFDTTHGITTGLVAGDGFEGYLATFDYSGSTITLSVVAIPEPSSAALALAGVMTAGWLAKRRRYKVLASP